MTSTLAAHQVTFILQYISPPSQLSHPIPSHLLSNSLLARHHFLSISPDQPLEYLCWPSHHRDQTIFLLESIKSKIDDIHASIPYEIQYTSDDEHCYAHVHVPSDHPGLRLIFQWDGVDAWKYHDASLMPFPLHSHPDLPDASVKLPERNEALQIEVEEADDDDYWNAYGNGNDSSDLSDNPVGLFGTKKDEDKTEDAYWAQYASVHGSGDSTVPSPLPKAHLKPNPPDLVLTDPFFTSDSDLHPEEPPSPNTLARRLSDISPRRSNHGTPVVTDDESDEGSYLSNGRPVLLLDENTLLSAPPVKHANGMSPHRTPRPPTSLPTSLPSVPDLHPSLSSLFSPPKSRDDVADSEEILKESIRGLWRLWKNGKHCNEDTDRQVFLKVVKEVIGETTA